MNTRFNARRRLNIEALLRFFATRDAKCLWPDDLPRIGVATGLQEWQVAQALDDLESAGRATMRPLADRVVIELQGRAGHE